MHAGFPCLIPNVQHVFKLGNQAGLDLGEIPETVEKMGGKLLANAIAVIARLGFSFVMRDSLLDRQKAKMAKTFFDENFVITDPNSPSGTRFYQGKFLIRTRKAGDEMNVLLKFCPQPDKLFKKTLFGEALDPFAVVSTETISEKEASEIESDPTHVDLVIQFKDIQSILGLVGREDVDVVGLLLENVVQLKGNVGHLFKLGAIGTNIETALGLDKDKS